MRDLSNLEYSILREQILQIRLGQAAREAFLAEHVGNRLRFALLQLPELLFHGAGRDQAVGIDGLGLAGEAMRGNLPLAACLFEQLRPPSKTLSQISCA